jgi:hypothetical protein
MRHPELSKKILLIGLLAIASDSYSEEAVQKPGYDLDIVFEPAAGQLVGSARIELPPSAINGGKVRLGIAHSIGSGVSIHSIRGGSDDELIHRMLDSGSLLEIDLDGPTASIGLRYSVPVDESMLDPYGYYVLQEFGPSNSGMYPQLYKADGSRFRFSDFEVSFTYPSGLSVLTTGGEGEQQRREGRTIATYAVEHVAGFAVVAGEGFEVVRNEAHGVPVVAFYHPDYAKQFGTVVERTIEAASWYLKTYGFFPLDQVGIIQGHPEWGGGYPLPNMFAIHLGALGSEHLTWITAHELGHFYWGYTVLGEEGALDWLTLSQGIWADQLYLAERKNITMTEQWRRERGQGAAFRDYLHAISANHNQQLGLSHEQVQDLDFDYNTLIRHSKSAVGVYLQSQLIGPDRFLDLQRHILEKFRHRPLTEAGLVATMTDFGFANAASFYDAWTLGDATIGVSVTEIVPDRETGGWTIKLSRTGTVPYPVEIQAVAEDGRTVTHSMGAEMNSDQFNVDFRPSDVKIDPRGILPMANSSHPEIQSVYALAMERAGLHEQFLLMARSVLEKNPDDTYLRYRLARHLYRLAEWEASAALWSADRAVDDRAETLAAIYHARALSRLGKKTEAMEQLDPLRAVSEQFGLLYLWDIVRGEVEE